MNGKVADRIPLQMYNFSTSRIQDLNVTNDDLNRKFAGITTDGESTNNGSKTGLLVRMENHVGHPLLNFWCVCHRSDLASENMFSVVRELNIYGNQN